MGSGVCRRSESAINACYVTSVDVNVKSVDCAVHQLGNIHVTTAKKPPKAIVRVDVLEMGIPNVP